ncbi:MAG: bifunctional 5,10-methylenetetrahydrofolate dehydrogenase/5,10-methenyltetrahydrofolate cyclohydrolase [Candidatus Limnocylindria bacterium]
MTSRLLDGRDVASHLRRDLQHRVARLADGEPNAAPQLAIIRSGSSEASALYASSLERAARSVGVEPLALTDDHGPLVDTIERLNDDARVAGIVVAQPLTDLELGRRLVERIDPAKDVDGATPANAGWLARGEPAFVPATALAVIALLEAYGIPVAGQRAVIIGRSAVVGRPVASLLLARDATVVICHRATQHLARETRRAELLIVAAGSAGLVQPEMVNGSVVVIDCGINSTPAGIVGDVDFATVAPVVRAISPVPGGVGPVTPMMVLRQTVEAAERAASHDTQS